MSKEFDPVEVIEKYFGIELMEYQKVMLRNIANSKIYLCYPRYCRYSEYKGDAVDYKKSNDFIRGRRLSDQESLLFCDEGQVVDLDVLNTIFKPFTVEIQSLFGMEDRKDE